MRGFLTALLCFAGLVAAEDTPIKIGRNDNIVVVGAGPAGLHYAKLLADKGFSRITVLDSGAKVGGKSKTIFDSNGVPHEMGTCYATSIYGPVFDLINKYDPTNVKVPFDMALHGHTWVHTDDTTTIDYNQFMIQAAYNVSPSDPMTVMAVALQKYITLHYKIFGKYTYGVPPQPKDWKPLQRTALQFLVDNDLLVLEAFFRSAFQRQGYGILDDTPAFYLLWWVHPDMILATLANPNVPSVFVLSNGFQSLWLKIAEAYAKKFTLKLNSTVTKLIRTGWGKTIVQYVQNGWLKVIVADHLVMAIDLSRPDAPSPKSLTKNEASFLHSLTAVTFVTTRFESEPIQKEGVCQWWPYRGAGALQGKLQATRNSHLALQGSSFNSSIVETGRQARVAYQFYNRAPKPEDSNTASLVADLNAISMSSPKLYERQIWNYAPRFPQNMLEQGALWKVWDHQGEAGTTWIGSSVSFESVLDVVTYNNKLIQRVQFKA